MNPTYNRLETLLRMREEFAPGSRAYIDSLIEGELEFSRKQQQQVPQGSPDDSDDAPRTLKRKERQIDNSSDLEVVQKPKRLRAKIAITRCGEIIAVRGLDDTVWYYEMQANKMGRLLLLEKDNYHYQTTTLDHIDVDTVLAYEVPMSQQVKKYQGMQFLRISIKQADREEHKELLQRSIEKSPHGVSSLNQVQQE